MGLEVQASDHARRNRRITIFAGAITIIAIVLGFAGDFLGLRWHWMRPAAELLLLAELVGLVVIERHQLFEPVQETVSGIDKRVADLQVGLDTLTKELRSDSQVRLYGSPSEIMRAITRITQEGLARDHKGPQILRLAELSGIMFAQDAREASVEMQEYVTAFFAYMVTRASPADSRSRRWSIRMLAAASTVAMLQRFMETGAPAFAQEPLNLEIKLFAKSRTESLLSPQTITDRETVLVLDDTDAAFRWGVVLEGDRYAGLFARWSDELWANLPSTQLIYSRSGLNQGAIDRIHKELEDVEAARARRNT